MKAKDMEKLISKESAWYSSETIMYKGRKFKISASNGNAYCRVVIEIYTDGGELAPIASLDDIPDAKRVDYIDADEERLMGNRRNIRACEAYIEKIY